MTLPPVPGVVNQVTGLIGEGDVDECAVASSCWCARYADPKATFPTVPVYRAAAGNPDDPSRPDGLTLDQTIRASSATWPHIRIAKYASTDWAAFERRLVEGWAANLGVISAELPAYLRFGFNGAHSVGVVMRSGAFLVANPLAAQGSAPLPCPVVNLQAAARKHGNGTILAALFQPLPAEVTEVVPVLTNTPATVHLAAGVTLYNLDRTPRKIKVSVAGDRYSPFISDATFRAVVVTTGGSQQLLLVKTASATNVRPIGDEKHTVTLQVDGAEISRTEV